MRTPEEREALIDKILDEYEAGVDKFNRDGWANRHGDKLNGLSDKAKAIYGDDFDIMKESYDEYHNDYNDLDEEDYCNKVDSYINDAFNKQLERLKSALGEGDIAEAQNIVEEIEEEAPAADKTTTIETTDPDIANDVAKDVTEKAEATSDENCKETIAGNRNPKADPFEKQATTNITLIKPRGSDATKESNEWLGSPHTSGGRQGKTSDEDAKEAADEQEDDTQSEQTGTIDTSKSDDSQKRLSSGLNKLKMPQVEQKAEPIQNEMGDFRDSVMKALQKYGK